MAFLRSTLRHSLSSKILLILCVLGLVSFGLFALIALRQSYAAGVTDAHDEAEVLGQRTFDILMDATEQFQEAYEQVQGDPAREKETIRRWSDRFSMLTRSIMTDHGNDYALVRLVGDSERFDYAPRGIETGLANPFERRAAEALLRGEKEYSEVDGEFFRIAYPLRSMEHPGCGSCHIGGEEGPGAEVGRDVLLGGLSVRLPLLPILQRARTSVWTAMLLTALILGLVLAALWLLIRRMIVRPIERCRKSIVALSHHDFKQYCDVQCQDEIGQVASAINACIASTHELIDNKVLFYESILDAIPHAVFTVDNERRFTYFNQAVQGHFVAENELLVNQPCTMLKTPICNTENCPIAYLQNRPEMSSNRTILSHSNGRYFDVVVGRIRNRAGRQIGFVQVASDITDFERLRQELTRERDLIAIAQQAAGAVCWEYDPGKQTFHTARSAGSTPLLPRKLTSFEQLLETAMDEDKPLVRKAIERIRSEKPVQGLKTFEHRDVDETGTVRWIRSTWTRVTDAEDRPRVVGMSIDVSQLKKAMLALELARERAEAGAQAKSRFLANMSHEIRSPMNGVVGMVELLGETDLSQTQRDYVETIRESSRLLLRIINDVLDLSKLEAGKTRLEFHPVNLCRVLDSVAASFHAATEEKGIRLLLHCDDAIPPLMMIDEFRLRQVLTNLIDNAVKFTMQGRVELRAVVQRAPKAVRASVLRGNISVKTGLMDEASHTVDVTFHVTDTGIGMSEDQKARIFEKFEQADSSTTRKFGGTGLGLTICRELIGLMGGRLSVQTSQGVGSDFSFTLPFRIAQVDHEYEDALRTESSDTFRARASAEYATSPEPPSQPQPQSPAAEDVARERETPPRAPAPTGKLAEARFQSLTILLAEDNKINQLVAQRMLREFGCEVEVASDGEEALAVARDRHFDIILMDCHMPVMDGYRATREIRHRGGASQHVPIIALTASALADDRQRCLEAGMDDFISKPVTLEDLKRILIRHGVKEEATEAEIEKKEQH